MIYLRAPSAVVGRYAALSEAPVMDPVQRTRWPWARSLSQRWGHTSNFLSSSIWVRLGGVVEERLGHCPNVTAHKVKLSQPREHANAYLLTRRQSNFIIKWPSSESE